MALTNTVEETIQAVGPEQAVGTAGEPGAGALVISLDFELHWGVRDIRPLDEAERARLLSARRMIPRILELFSEFDIHATWATVGFLHARSRAEIEELAPACKPLYKRVARNPYAETIGADEAEDPFHFGASLIEQIARLNGQELASHSFSHYYCKEPEHSTAAFEADLKSAIAIAARRGYETRSYVFPRNQVDAACLSILDDAGICYRATEPSAMNAPGDYAEQRRFHKRLARLADSYVDLFGLKTHRWPLEDHPVSLPASRYLAPLRPGLAALEDLRRQRIVKAMAHAAVEGQIFHLWWHPEDFAYDCDHNMQFLRSLIIAFDELRYLCGMQSLTMAEAAMIVRSGVHA